MPNKLIPGLAAALGIGLVSRALSRAIVIRGANPISEVILAIVLGLAIRSLWPQIRPVIGAGANFAMKRLLRWGIVLLGLGLSLRAVVQAGAGSLAIIVVTVAAALVVTRWLGGAVGVRAKLATLIAVGVGICGASAIVAAAPAIDADQDDVCYAVGVITVFGIIAVFAYPLIGAALALADRQFGTWAGVAVHDTAQVIAAGFTYSEAAGQVATVVKLTRTALLAPLVLGLAALHRRTGGGGQRVRAAAMFPWFIVGFAAMAVARSLGDAAFLGAAAPAWAAVKHWANYAAKLLIVTAMAGVGLSTGLETFCVAGLKPMAIGLVASVLVGVASIGLILLLGV